MSHSNSRGRSSIHDLPPKMAHKSSLPPKVSAKQAQQYYYSPYTNQNSYGSTTSYQSGSQVGYQQDQAYQSYIPKGRSGSSLQNKPQQDNDSMNGANSKRSISSSTQYKQNSKETTNENKFLQDYSLNPQNPPLSFNIVCRGNIPGLVFQQVLINA